jgi:hypothetical protein
MWIAMSFVSIASRGTACDGDRPVAGGYVERDPGEAFGFRRSAKRVVNRQLVVDDLPIL